MTDKDIEVIVKPIFTKMFKGNFSACDYGIECYKKGMEYQGIKELAIENDNLIKKIVELEAQIEKMKCCNNCKYKNINWSFQPICTVRKNDDRDIENPITFKCKKWELAEN